MAEVVTLSGDYTSEEMGWDYFTKPAEYFWRPSKISLWAQPAGAALTAGGMIPSPASPYLIGAGAILTIGGGASSYKLSKDRERRAKTENEKSEIRRETNQKNMLYFTLAALGLGTMAVIAL